MKRQISIRSFFQKPAAENNSYGDSSPSCTGGAKVAGESFPHVPAKEPRGVIDRLVRPVPPTSKVNISIDAAGTNTPSYTGGANAAGNSFLHLPATEPRAVMNRLVRPFPPTSKVDISIDAAGTDTPPEKPPRPFFSMAAGAMDLTPSPLGSSKQSSLFSSIMHKFVKVDDKPPFSQRNLPNGDPSTIIRSMSDKFNCEAMAEGEFVASKTSRQTNSFNFNHSKTNERSAVPDTDEQTVGPETPGERPFVPRLKRIIEDFSPLNDIRSDVPGMRPSKKGKFSSLNDIRSDAPEIRPSKKAKFIPEPKSSDEPNKENLEAGSKFDWLSPLYIKDARGRRPNDPLYDKRTLYIPPDVFNKLSASQKQYWGEKRQYMDIVLFFKVGKFYELYELDAEIGHKELDWKMTYSGVGKCRQVGISEGAIDDAVQKLVARGYKVGRIEQMETSEQAKRRGGNSVIQRKLVSVIAPSMAVDENIGPDAVHLLSIKEEPSKLDHGPTTFGFAFVDCAASKIWVGSVTDDASCAALGALLMQVSPKEILYESRGLSKEAQKAIKKYSSTGCTWIEMTPLNPVQGFLDAEEVKQKVHLNHYFKGSEKLWDHLLDSVIHYEVALSALGGLIDQLSRLMMEDILRNGDVLPYQVYEGCLRIDGQSMINLEIFHNNTDGGSAGTLYKYLDHCMTSFGKRLLRSWICHPLKDVEGIAKRVDVVDCFINHPEIMLVVANYLRKVPDLERMLGRVQASVQSAETLLLPLVGKKVLKQRVKAFGTLVKGMRAAMDLLSLLQKEPINSLLLKILELPVLSGHGSCNEFLTQFEAAIDSDFPKYQDHDLVESDAGTLSILIELFVERAKDWSQVVYAISCIDVLRSFAVIVNQSSGPMSRPSVQPLSTSTQQRKGPMLKIKGLWHPFALGENGVPVPNDLDLGGDENDQVPRTLLLTGPNMGGKSTLLRASCVAVLLAQLGCYVPSESCTLSLADIIFTRLGATDRIMTGESTFYIECAETASVLHNATQNSLVILDELGRGTSTHDGYAIAYAVFRHLLEKLNCRLLFATHYHPLTKEFASHPRVSNRHMACTFRSSSGGKKEELVFLYRLAEGPAPASYGLQVALKAGIPEQVVEAARKAAQVMKEILKKSFRSSENRAEFSALHETWLKDLVSLSRSGGLDDDAYDTLFCIWHEVKRAYGC